MYHQKHHGIILGKSAYVNKYKRYLPILAVVLVALGINLDQFGIDLKSLANGGNPVQAPLQSDNTADAQTTDYVGSSSADSGSKWSDTDPNINLHHIFDGEINRSGKPVGFHSRPGGQDPAGARLISIRDKPNRAGVYTATIEIRDGDEWKSKFSSFFPDNMGRKDVINAVLNAYHNSENHDAQPFEGPSGLGFTVQGYTSSRGGINTAFPIYVRNQ